MHVIISRPITCDIISNKQPPPPTLTFQNLITSSPVAKGMTGDTRRSIQLVLMLTDRTRHSDDQSKLHLLMNSIIQQFLTTLSDTRRTDELAVAVVGLCDDADGSVQTPNSELRTSPEHGDVTMATQLDCTMGVCGTAIEPPGVCRLPGVLPPPPGVCLVQAGECWTEWSRVVVPVQP